MLWVPGNRQAVDAGIDDPLDDARRFLVGQIGPAIRPELVEAYLQSGREAVDYLERHTAVRFELAPAPDYVTDVDGGTTIGGALATPEFDGRLLGRSLWRGGDMAIIDGGLVNGSAKGVAALGSLMRNVQSGYLYSYAFWMIIGLAMLLGYFLWRAFGF